jgi:aminotransferase
MKRLGEREQVCSRCVMDTTDPEITFDEEGVCSHCRKFDQETINHWFPNSEGERKLGLMFEKIRLEGRQQEYDCIIGLSGGIDSSYLALVMKDYDLRPLVVHIDAGWNSELAVYNIEKIVKFCNYDLHTHVMDWPEVRDLQVAYLKAGVANQDVVQDHAFFASLYHFAVKNNIKYVISGGNIATESVFPASWHHSAMDAINLHDIHKSYGKIKLKHYKTISFFSYFFYYPFIRGMTVVRPLNFMRYHKKEALHILKETIGYKEYGYKHGESVFTKFFQNYYLPIKFGIDKRKPHLSSQILSGEITRDHALEELDKQLYSDNDLMNDKIYISKKLGIKIKELDDMIFSKSHHYSEYSNWNYYRTPMLFIKRITQKILRKNIKTYS